MFFCIMIESYEQNQVYLLLSGDSSSVYMQVYDMSNHVRKVFLKRCNFSVNFFKEKFLKMLSFCQKSI